MGTPAHRRATTSVVGQQANGNMPARTVAVTQEYVPYPFEIVRPTDLDRPDALARVLLRLQEHARDSTVSARSLPCLGGSYFPNVKMAAGQTIVLAHNLGIEVTFEYLDMRLTNGGLPLPPFDAGQDAPAFNRLFVKTWVAMTVDLWVFPRPKAINKDPINSVLNNYVPPTGGVNPPNPGPVSTSGGVLVMTPLTPLWVLFIASDIITLPPILPPNTEILFSHDRNRSMSSLDGPGQVTFQAPAGAPYLIQDPDGRLNAGGTAPLTKSAVHGTTDGANYRFRFDGTSAAAPLLRCVN